MNPIPQIVAIRNRRKALNITRKKLADCAGISAIHLSRLESGVSSNPTVNTVLELEKALAYFEANTLQQGG